MLKSKIGWKIGELEVRTDPRTYANFNIDLNLYCLITSCTFNFFFFFWNFPLILIILLLIFEKIQSAWAYHIQQVYSFWEFFQPAWLNPTSLLQDTLEYLLFNIRQGEAEFHILKLNSIFHLLPSVSAKQPCVLAHLGWTRQAGTS